jgi:polar amino acid transport system substrate-binding protein
VNQVVDSVTRLSRHFLRKGTRRFELELAESLPPVQADRIRLEQVLLNLLQNAVASLPSADRRVWVRTALSDDGSAVVLEVGDQGLGITDQDLTRIRDPFFSTRRQSGGTGLGLSIADRIVKDHGGSMAFHSRPGEGTRVLVSIPTHAGAP